MPVDVGNGGGGGRNLFRRLSLRRQPVEFHGSEESSTSDVAKLWEAASSTRPPTGSACSPASSQDRMGTPYPGNFEPTRFEGQTSMKQGELTANCSSISSCHSTGGGGCSNYCDAPESASDDWKSWKTESTELGMSKLPHQHSGSRRQSRRTISSNASSTGTSRSPSRSATERPAVSDGAEHNPSFEPLAHLPEEASTKWDSGELRKDRLNKAKRPITPHRVMEEPSVQPLPPTEMAPLLAESQQERQQQQQQPQLQLQPLPQPVRPQSPDQPRSQSASSVAGQARQVERQSAWNRYMPRFLSTPRRGRAASHSVGTEAGARNATAAAVAANFSTAFIADAAEPQAQRRTRRSKSLR